MYTHLYINHENAEKLFKKFAPKPLKSGQSGLVTMATFGEHFAKYSQTPLVKLGTALESEPSRGRFVLKFDRYLPSMPQELVELGVEFIEVSIVRFNSAPIKARAGYYADPKSGFTATVDRICPRQILNGSCTTPLYAMNIFVSGPTLEAAQEFNTKLSGGSYNRFLVNAFE
jgi:hypothetical protein